MHITFMGAARTVTGSCFVLEAAGTRFAIDAGLHQGGAEVEKRNWDVDAYRPGDLRFILMTHAHIDHAGLLPRLVRNGFRGAVHATPPTRDLLRIMLLDSAHIQEMEALWKNRRRIRRGDPQAVPLYTRADAEATFPLFETHVYGEAFTPAPGIRVTFRDAGHILGSAIIEIDVTENGETQSLVFSGDLGRPDALLMADPAVVERADWLFLESTYGNRNHRNEDDTLAELAEAISYSRSRGEKVIIPAFAVERTQELMYSLYLLSGDGRLPRDMPVFLDSPLAIQATEIFRQHPDYLDEKTRDLLARGEDPLRLPQLRCTPSTEESMAINTREGPAVVISASGMANAGRIKHHLRHNLWREGASIVFVGFQAQGTPGRRIVDGAKKIRIFQDDVAVKARIFTINGFSAHAGQEDLLAWLGHFRPAPGQIVLVHGEYETQQVLAKHIRERFGRDAVIPDYREAFALPRGKEAERRPSPAAVMPPVPWETLVREVEADLQRLREGRVRLEGKSWPEQTEFQERLREWQDQLRTLLAEI